MCGASGVHVQRIVRVDEGFVNQCMLSFVSLMTFVNKCPVIMRTVILIPVAT